MKQVRGWVDLQMLSSQKSFKNPLANDKDKSRQKQNFAFFFNFQKTDEKYKQMNVKVSQAGGTYSLWQVSCLNNWDSHCHRTPPPLPTMTMKTAPSHRQMFPKRDAEKANPSLLRTSTLYEAVLRLPWRLSGKEVTCPCRKLRFEPCSKIPYASEQTGHCATATEPVL